jgi:hypothetical protein
MPSILVQAVSAPDRPGADTGPSGTLRASDISSPQVLVVADLSTGSAGRQLSLDPSTSIARRSLEDHRFVVARRTGEGLGIHVSSLDSDDLGEPSCTAPGLYMEPVTDPFGRMIGGMSHLLFVDDESVVALAYSRRAENRIDLELVGLDVSDGTKASVPIPPSRSLFLTRLLPQPDPGKFLLVTAVGDALAIRRAGGEWRTQQLDPDLRVDDPSNRADHAYVDFAPSADTGSYWALHRAGHIVKLDGRVAGVPLAPLMTVESPLESASPQRLFVDSDDRLAAVKFRSIDTRRGLIRDGLAFVDLHAGKRLGSVQLDDVTDAAWMHGELICGAAGRLLRVGPDGGSELVLDVSPNRIVRIT